VTTCDAPWTAPGRGILCVTRSRSHSRSIVSRAYATSPLRLLTPTNHGHAAWIYTASYGGGLVDGDRIALDVEIGDGAAAFVSTQASTKVYRSPRGTSAELRARIAPDGLLVLAPDPVVCFAASRYRQIQQFDLARGATLVALDWMSSGRRAAGERWVFDEYVAQISVRLDDRLIVHDVLALRAEDGDLAARMGRFEVIAIAVLTGAENAALRNAAADIVSRIGAMPLGRRANRLLAATMLGDDGCVVRVGGMSVEQVGRTMRELLAFVPAMLGDDPWTRKW
jgi:urease accessory protein